MQGFYNSQFPDLVSRVTIGKKYLLPIFHLARPPPWPTPKTHRPPLPGTVGGDLSRDPPRLPLPPVQTQPAATTIVSCSLPSTHRILLAGRRSPPNTHRLLLAGHRPSAIVSCSPPSSQHPSTLLLLLAHHPLLHQHHYPLTMESQSDIPLPPPCGIPPLPLPRRSPRLPPSHGRPSRGQIATQNPPARKPMKKRSIHWKFYVPCTNEYGNAKARCIICQNLFAATGGTTGLKKHHDVCSRKNSKVMAYLNLQPRTDQVSNWKFDQLDARRVLVEMILLDELPFRFVEHEGFRRFMCVAHIINLVVTDGLKESRISIERVREAVKWVKSSPARLAQFKKYISFKGIESNRLVSLDVSTRWNSTYMMMEVAEKYEDAFKLLEGNDCNFKSHLDRQIFRDAILGPPTFMDWENVRMLMKYFKFFYDMTIRVSGTAYVTTHLFCKELIDVFDEIHDLERSYDFEMYEPERRENFAKEVKDAIYEMFGYYKQLLGSNVQPRVSSPNVRDDGNVPASRRKEGTNAEFMKKKVESINRGSRKVSKSELERYMSNDEDDEPLTIEDLNASNYDILGWWMRNEMRYPILSAMPRDILVVPITTVASESTFSTG
ncbi:Putative AC transposase [Linum grandiflorum]